MRFPQITEKMGKLHDIAKHWSPNTNASIRLWLILLLCSGLFSGCEESLTSTLKRQPTVPKNELQDQAIQILLQALADPNPHLRTSAIEVVAQTGQIRLMPRVQKLLNDQYVPVRFLAILAVGDLQYGLASEELVTFLKDDNPNIRIAAAYALYKLGHQQYFRVFRDAITSKDQTIRANAALLLGKSGNIEATRYLYWALQNSDSDDKVILQVAESIATLGDEKIYPKLWTRLISAYADDRVIGVKAMGALGTEQAQQALATMLDDSVVEVRLAAVAHLGKLGNTTGQAQVLEVYEKNILNEMDPQRQSRVKVLMALAIGEIGTDRLAKYLPQLLQDQSKLVQIAAAKAALQYSAKR